MDREKVIHQFNCVESASLRIIDLIYMLGAYLFTGLNWMQLSCNIERVGCDVTTLDIDIHSLCLEHTQHGIRTKRANQLSVNVNPSTICQISMQTVLVWKLNDKSHFFRAKRNTNVYVYGKKMLRLLFIFYSSIFFKICTHSYSKYLKILNVRMFDTLSTLNNIKNFFRCFFIKNAK